MTLHSMSLAKNKTVVDSVVKRKFVFSNLLISHINCYSVIYIVYLIACKGENCLVNYRDHSTSV